MNQREFWKLWRRSFLLQTGFCYERLQALGWCWILWPLARGLNKTERLEFLKNHLKPFNANPYISTYAIGAVAKLSQEKKSDAEIERLKDMLRGPLGSLGDSFIWRNLRPALLALGTTLSYWTGFWGAVAFLVIFNLSQIYLRYRGLREGYRLGEETFRDFNTFLWRKVPTLVAGVGAGLLGFLLFLKGAEFYNHEKEILVIFGFSLAVSALGFVWRKQVFDIFLWALGGSLVLKIIFRIASL